MNKNIMKKTNTSINTKSSLKGNFSYVKYYSIVASVYFSRTLNLKTAKDKS